MTTLNNTAQALNRLRQVAQEDGVPPLELLLMRISLELERHNELMAKQNSALKEISDTIFSAS
jgi:hypothetical protein